MNDDTDVAKEGRMTSIDPSAEFRDAAACWPTALVSDLTNASIGQQERLFALSIPCKIRDDGIFDIVMIVPDIKGTLQARRREICEHSDFLEWDQKNCDIAYVH